MLRVNYVCAISLPTVYAFVTTLFLHSRITSIGMRFSIVFRSHSFSELVNTPIYFVRTPRRGTGFLLKEVRAHAGNGVEPGRQHVLVGARSAANRRGRTLRRRNTRRSRRRRTGQGSTKTRATLRRFGPRRGLAAAAYFRGQLQLPNGHVRQNGRLPPDRARHTIIYATRRPKRSIFSE